MTTSTLTPDTPSTPDPAATAATTQLPSVQSTVPQAGATQPASTEMGQYAYPPARPTNVLGIVTLVLGVLGFAIVPVITGHIALAQIKRTGDDGRGITIAGLVLGYIGLAGYLLAALFFFGALFLGAIGAIGSYR
jgi:hypothetical protein